MHKRRYPAGIQTFSVIIEGGYIYADNTEYIHHLASEGKYYLLSRPRRFGKSLLLSTIEAYYSGRHELFKGLAIERHKNSWETHPVLHIDLNSDNYEDEVELDHFLDLILSRWEEIYGITNPAVSIGQRFGDVIAAAYTATGKRTVILIDEYDKPMLSAIDDEPKADRLRRKQKAFYSNLKSMDRYIEFAMLTGVARFSKISIFSDLNNLRDISFEPKYSGICGITAEELNKYFSDGIHCLAKRTNKTFQETQDELKSLYDGYHFADDLKDIYNPFSLVYVFASERLSNYWFDSGTPSYVVKLMRKCNWKLKEIDHYKIKATHLASEGILTHDLIPSLYQAGYLTIKKYDPTFKQFTLGYPNKEVEEGFVDFLLPISSTTPPKDG